MFFDDSRKAGSIWCRNLLIFGDSILIYSNDSNATAKPHLKWW